MNFPFKMLHNNTGAIVLITGETDPNKYGLNTYTGKHLTYPNKSVEVALKLLPSYIGDDTWDDFTLKGMTEIKEN